MIRSVATWKEAEEKHKPTGICTGPLATNEEMEMTPEPLLSPQREIWATLAAKNDDAKKAWKKLEDEYPIRKDETREFYRWRLAFNVLNPNWGYDPIPSECIHTLVKGFSVNS